MNYSLTPNGLQLSPESARWSFWATLVSGFEEQVKNLFPSSLYMKHPEKDVINRHHNPLTSLLPPLQHP